MWFPLWATLRRTILRLPLCGSGQGQCGKQDDAKYATRIVRNILTEVLPYLNIFMTEELSESERKELEALNLEITTQYTQKPQDEETEEGGEDEENNQTPESGENQPAWMSFPVDPATGYRVDPATGYLYDAQEGFWWKGTNRLWERTAR